jgi:hypothetical protein
MKNSTVFLDPRSLTKKEEEDLERESIAKQKELEDQQRIELGQKIINQFISLFILPIIFMVCWNYAATSMFKANEINYMHSFAFLIIVKIIRGSKQ